MLALPLALSARCSAARHRSTPRHARDDRHRHADGAGDEERHSLVELTNQLRREKGLGVIDAILEAGPVRLRPILMTSLAMVLGMLPSAFGVGEGGEFPCADVAGDDWRRR